MEQTNAPRGENEACDVERGDEHHEERIVTLQAHDDLHSDWEPIERTESDRADAFAQADMHAAADRMLAAKKQWDEECKERFKPHLDSLEKKYVAKVGARGFTRDDLFEILTTGATIYAGRRHTDDRHAQLNDLLAAARPMSFLQLLKYERSFNVCVLADGCSRQEMKRAAERYRDLMRDLEKIVGALPDRPPGRGKGRPPRNPKDLYVTVAFLVSQYARLTGKRFSQSWHKDDNGHRVPLAGGSAAFVYDIVKLIDPSRVDEVPKITEGIVREHNQGTPYWTIFSRNLSGER